MARVVVVSGGSKGLGAAIVARLLGAGDEVATFSRSRTPFVDEMIAAHGARFAWTALDATDAAGVRAFVRDVEAQRGRIDALINNAAVAMERVLPLVRDEDVGQVLAANVQAPIFLSSLCSRSMIRHRSGAIVNVTSIVGTRGYAGLSVYGATKAALDGFTRALARELGSHGVRVNSIAPGYVETDMSASLTREQRSQIVRRTPLGRLGTAEDVAAAVEFLLSPGAAFITGQTLVVDGGITC